MKRLYVQIYLTVVASLLPIMWSTSTGAEVMKPLATPVLGGMVSSLAHVLLVTPVSGAVSLTLLLIAFFVLEGILSIMYALEHRQQLSGAEWPDAAASRLRRIRRRDGRCFHGGRRGRAAERHEPDDEHQDECCDRPCRRHWPRTTSVRRALKRCRSGASSCATPCGRR